MFALFVFQQFSKLPDRLLHDSLSENDIKVNSFVSYFFIVGMRSVMSCIQKKK
jgi:hypothetical protein